MPGDGIASPGAPESMEYLTGYTSPWQGKSVPPPIVFSSIRTITVGSGFSPDLLDPAQELQQLLSRRSRADPLFLDIPPVGNYTLP